jgi:flagellin
MNVLIGANDVILNLDRNQQAFENTVTQLSSGLRINSAADDPSGNAITVNLTSKYEGLQQSAQNVQNGVNALNVANGALVQVQNILIRINNLLVESNSDINSTSDLDNIQTEIQQLLSEINTIGEKTNFNGQNLLDGQFDTAAAAQATIAQVNSPYGGSDTVSNADGAGNPGLLITDPVVDNGVFNPAGLIVFTVEGYSDNGVDPDSGLSAGGPAIYLRIDQYSTTGSWASTPLYSDVLTLPYSPASPLGGSGTGTSTGVFNFNYGLTGPDGASPGVISDFTVANLTAADVGASIAFVTTAATTSATGTALQINDGGDEGQILSFSMPTVSTNALGLSQISVLQPTMIQQTPGQNGPYSGYPPEISTSSSNNVAASYSESLVQTALTTITTQEAQIGAQVVAMNDDESDDNTAIVNYEASASNIADLNVGQATTDYTREQILTQVGTEVLSQIQTQGKMLTGLLINALIA